MADIKVKRKNITYDHEVTFFVPVFQRDFKDDGDLTYSPCFQYSMSDATADEQMAWSHEPDYVLELFGRFNATTKDLIIKDDE
jgi:hypothetical protein